MPGNRKQKHLSKHFPDFNLESFFLISFVRKNLTDFCKTVETGVDLRLRGVKGAVHLFTTESA